MSFTKLLGNYFRAAFPAVAIQTSEEARACADAIAVAKELGRSIVSWSATDGFVVISKGGQKISDSEDLMAACRLIVDGVASERSPKSPFKDAIVIFRDVHAWPFDRDPILTRSLRDALSALPGVGSSAVFISPEFKPPREIERLVTIAEYALPDTDALRTIAREIAKAADLPYDDKADAEVLKALGGLSTSEAENALSLSCVEAGKLDPAVIYREKVKAVRRSGLLDIVEADPRGLDAIGGLDELKEWLRKRRRAFSAEAEAFGLPAPKGIMLCGVPGTGKSLSAKAVGTAFGLPTLKLDLGKLFNSLVGESESRTRDALALAEAMSPCILWVDEIDKGLAGAGASGSSDSGVTRRVFGSIIAWMQERRRPVFLVATANQLEGLPPELLRKGRFDELFALDLPTHSERVEIFGVHLARRKIEIGPAGVAKAAMATGGFTGSEIEAVIDEAMFSAFDSGAAAPSGDDLVDAAASIVPLSKTAEAQIKAIQEWARSSARYASRRSETQADKPAQSRKLAKG